MLGAAAGRNCRTDRQRGRGWTAEVHGRLVHFGAALIFVLPACGLLSTAATRGLVYGKLESYMHEGRGTQQVLVVLSVFPVCHSCL